MPNINECGVKVLYPMDVRCSVVNPTTLTSSDGSATLIISGGTPPYSILWDNGDLTNGRHNLMGGEYSASVTDYYGDFVINTTCVLTQPQPTTTTTTTTTTAQPTYTLCMNISRVIETFTTFTQITFNPNGLYLGYQSWISQDSVHKLYWDQTITSWKLSGSTMNIISPDPSYPPLNGWQLLGDFGVVSVNQGVCIPRPVTSFRFTTTNPTCTCDGGIIIQATGPDTPFQYSINNGLNWFNSPVFTSLCGGVYPLAVKDSLGNIYRDSATLNAVIPTITYTLQPDGDAINEFGASELTFRIHVTPPLPPGVTITFDVVLSNNFSRTPFAGSATNNLNYQLTKSSVIIPVSSTNVVNNTTPSPFTWCSQYMNYNTLTTKKWSNLTIQGSESYVLTAGSIISPNCGYVEEGSDVALYETRFNTDDSIKFGIDLEDDTSTYRCCTSRLDLDALTENIRISGCDCCKVVIGWRKYYTRM
jgi:hypothetical protein